MIKKDTKTSLRKQANELKVQEKTVWTAIEQDFSRSLNSVDYAIWGVLEKKTNATSHPNICSLQIATVEEWYKMSEEFIFKACTSFQKRVDTLIEKNGCHIVYIHCFCLSSYFVVYYF